MTSLPQVFNVIVTLAGETQQLTRKWKADYFCASVVNGRRHPMGTLHLL